MYERNKNGNLGDDDSHLSWQNRRRISPRFRQRGGYYYDPREAENAYGPRRLGDEQSQEAVKR